MLTESQTARRLNGRYGEILDGAEAIAACEAAAADKLRSLLAEPQNQDREE